MQNVKEKVCHPAGIKSFTSPLDQYLRVRPSVAIDVGTSTTRVFTHNGLLIEKPSCVPLRAVSENGSNTELMLYPLRAGVIRDLPAAISLLRPMLRKSRRFGIDPIAVACVPTTASIRDRQRLHDVLLTSGCSSVEMIQEPLAAAIGAKLDVSNEYAQMLIDIGEGVTDIAIIQENKLIRTRGLHVACGSVIASIQKRIYGQHGIWLTHSHVRRILMEQSQLSAEKGILIRQNDHEAQILISKQDIVDAMKEPIKFVSNAVVQFFRQLPDEIAAQVIETGITVSGGGATLPTMVDKLQEVTSLDVHVVDDPLHSVIRGAASLFESA